SPISTTATSLRLSVAASSFNRSRRRGLRRVPDTLLRQLRRRRATQRPIRLTVDGQRSGVKSERARERVAVTAQVTLTLELLELSTDQLALTTRLQQFVE